MSTCFFSIYIYIYKHIMYIGTSGMWFAWFLSLHVCIPHNGTKEQFQVMRETRADVAWQHLGCILNIAFGDRDLSKHMFLHQVASMCIQGSREHGSDPGRAQSCVIIRHQHGFDPARSGSPKVKIYWVAKNISRWAKLVALHSRSCYSFASHWSKRWDPYARGSWRQLSKFKKENHALSALSH